MSSLWTPGGERPARRTTQGERANETAGTAGPGPSRPDADDFEHDLSDAEKEQMAARLEELQRQIVSAPAEVVVANHAYGLFELAAIHLSQTPPRLEDARLAVDAMAGIVENLEGRLGEPEKSLRDALAQVRLAYIQISGARESTSQEQT